MAKQSTKSKRKAPQSTNRGGYISIDTATLVFAVQLFTNDRNKVERLIKLALRGPDVIKFWLTLWLQSMGVNVEQLIQNEPSTPASKAELIELVKPVLEEGAKLASFARLFDLYLLGSQPTPESMVYIFYIIVRYYVSRDKEPTKEQSKTIWSITLQIVRTSNIGARHWEELERRGAVALEDWQDVVKENARKRFKTFLNQKKNMEENADKTFQSLFSFLFDGEGTRINQS